MKGSKLSRRNNSQLCCELFTIVSQLRGSLWNFLCKLQDNRTPEVRSVPMDKIGYCGGAGFQVETYGATSVSSIIRSGCSNPILTVPDLSSTLREREDQRPDQRSGKDQTKVPTEEDINRGNNQRKQSNKDQTNSNRSDKGDQSSKEST